MQLCEQLLRLICEKRKNSLVSSNYYDTDQSHDLTVVCQLCNGTQQCDEIVYFISQLTQDVTDANVFFMLWL